MRLALAWVISFVFLWAGFTMYLILQKHKVIFCAIIFTLLVSMGVTFCTIKLAVNVASTNWERIYKNAVEHTN